VKCGARIAMGVAGGYFLGRTKKMKLALMLGGWAAGRQLGGPGQIFGQASRMLGESPELSALTDQVRGRLLEAGKDAAMAVATRRVEALTDRVGQRVEELADVRRVADRDVRRVADVGGLDIASRNGEEDGLEEEDFEEEEEQPAPPTRARTSDSRAARTSGNSRAAAGSRSGNSRAAAGSRSGNSRAAAGSRSAGASRSSANTRAVGGKRSSDQRSSSSSGPKAASSTSPSSKTSSTSPRSKSSTRTQTAKKGATSSSRTPKKAGTGRKASRTAPTQREDSNG
jgi:hypothetical protein